MVFLPFILLKALYCAEACVSFFRADLSLLFLLGMPDIVKIAEKSLKIVKLLLIERKVNKNRERKPKLSFFQPIKRPTMPKIYQVYISARKPWREVARP